jgi:hypothetical protein
MSGEMDGGKPQRTSGKGGQRGRDKCEGDRGRVTRVVTRGRIICHKRGDSADKTSCRKMKNYTSPCHPSPLLLVICIGSKSRPLPVAS